jgi:osmoprotectant transport system permease protein
VAELLSVLPDYLQGHLRVTLAALGVAVALGLPAGIGAARAPRLERLVLGLAAGVQTVPSLALLAVMVPLLALLGLPSIGVLPAFLGLVAYTTFPILQMTVVGLRGVDSSAIEAAHALGMTESQRLWRVELPLALPVLLAGVRTAAVLAVGTATLSTPVGATSLGNYIFAGLQTRDYASVGLGCALSAATALALDGLLRLASWSTERRKPAGQGLAVAGLLALGALSWLPLGPRSQEPVVIGAKTFTEQYILSELLSERIRRETDLPSEVRSSLGSTVAFDALVAGDLDVYVDYSGTLWATVLHEQPPSRAQAVEALGVALQERYGVVLVCALGFENTYALALPAARARELGLVHIGDLARVAPGWTIGADYEFFARPEWVSVRDRYGLSFSSLRSMDPSLMYSAVQTGSVDVITAFSTDGRITSFDLAVLQDDLGALPPYDAVVLASAALARDRPEVLRALQDLSIDAEQMRRMNAAVDADGLGPAEVARKFLGGGFP